MPVDLMFDKRKDPSSLSLEEISIRKNGYLSSVCAEQQKIAGLTPSPDSYRFPPKVAISDGYLDSVNKSKIALKRGDISSFDKLDVIFQDGSKEAFECILFSTGYNPSLSYLSDEILKAIDYNQQDQLQPIILYEATIHPELTNMFFVGMYRGPYFAVMEQQAKWSMGILKGDPLPSADEFAEGLAKELAIRTELPRPQFPHGDYVAMLDRLCEHTKSMTVVAAMPDEIAEIIKKGPLVSAHCLLSTDSESAAKQLLALSEYISSDVNVDYQYHLSLLETDLLGS